MKQVLYNGTVSVELDDRHCYSVNYTEAKPDGVTTILRLVPKHLLPWVARTTADYIHKGILDRLAVGTVEVSFLASLCEEAKQEHTRKKEAAGDIGTLVHAFAEKTLKLETCPLPPPNAPEYQGCKAFLEWLRGVEIDWDTAEVERFVHSKRLFYCGKTDLFAPIYRKRAVVDLKTGSGFYEEQPLQLGGYGLALEEELGIEIKDGWIIHLDKESGKCTPYFVEITPELKKDWEAVRIAWRAVKRNQDRHKQIKGNQKCRTSLNIIQAESL